MKDIPKVVSPREDRNRSKETQGIKGRESDPTNRETDPNDSDVAK